MPDLPASAPGLSRLAAPLRWLRRGRRPSAPPALPFALEAPGKTILVLDHSVPKPDQDAGSRAMFDLLSCLTELGWRIGFWPQDRAWHPRYTAGIEALGIAVLDQREPLALDAWIARHGQQLDQVLISRASVAEALAMPVVAGCTAPIAYFGVDIAFRRLEMGAALGQPSAPASLARTRALERRLWRLFERVIYLSEEEAGIVRALEPSADARSIVPFCYADFPDPPPPPSDPLLLFVAGFAHAPNVDAAGFLVREILPLLRREVPARVMLVGSHPAPVQALAGPAVSVTGWVDDATLAGCYRRARVAVAPLRYGAGVKGKVVEALRQGVPLVTTPVGAQGIPGLAGLAPVAETPAALAAAILALLRDDAAWVAQARAQRDYARAHYSKAAMRESVFRALEIPTGSRPP